MKFDTFPQDACKTFYMSTFMNSLALKLLDQNIIDFLCVLYSTHVEI